MSTFFRKADLIKFLQTAMLHNRFSTLVGMHISSIGWGGGVTEHFRAPYSIIAIRCSYSISVEQIHGQSSVSYTSFFVD